MAKFDILKKKNRDGNLESFFGELPEATKDCQDLKECLKHYNLLDHNCYNLDKNPTLEEVNKTMKAVEQRILEGKR